MVASEIVNEIIVGIIVGLAVYIVTSFFSPQPRDIVAFWLRKYIKARKLEGSSISIKKHYDILGGYNYEELMTLIGLTRGKESPFYKTLMDVVGENNEPGTFDKVGQYVFSARYVNKLTHGSIKVGCIVNDEDQDELVAEMVIEITSEKWKYSKTPQILASLYEILTRIESNHLIKNLGNEIKMDNLILITLKIEREPIAIQYLSKMNVELIMASGNGFEYSLGKDKMTIKGNFQNDLISKVMDAMVWYL